MEVAFVTSSKIKTSIAQEVLDCYGISVSQTPFDFREIQSCDIEEVALDKAKQAAEKLDQALMIDDSGIYVDALNSFPGALLKTFNQKLGYERICKLMEGEKNRRATYVNALVFYDPKTATYHTFFTNLTGSIASSPRGDRKLGWAIDRIFIPDGYDKTLAELDEKEWSTFWENYKNGMHYKSFGVWAKSNLVVSGGD